MAVTLHRCPFMFLKTGSHACWRVQQALDEEGIDYEVRKEWAFPKSRRTVIGALSGQHSLPVIEFEDGTGYRAESKEMAARIRAGELFSEPPSA